MGFQCRQFYIKDDQCAMKVSTDSLILGSYVPLDGVSTLLDMGTGSGLLALMLAQRAPTAQVDAFDADLQAVAQARENVAASPWPTRIKVAHACVSNWQGDYHYQRIVVNPPYFSGHLASSSQQRQLARQGQVTPTAWLECALRNLALDGQLYWVLPASQTELWSEIARGLGLKNCRTLQVKTTARKPVKLMIQGWQRGTPSEVVVEQLVIHAQQGRYSDAYRQLTGAFYLAGQ